MSLRKTTQKEEKEIPTGTRTKPRDKREVTKKKGRKKNRDYAAKILKMYSRRRNGALCALYHGLVFTHRT